MAQLGMIEQKMLDVLNGASPAEQEELARLAQEKTVPELTSILQERYPSYASYITEDRVTHVMQAYQQGRGASPAGGQPAPTVRPKKAGFWQRLGSILTSSDEEPPSALSELEGLATGRGLDPETGASRVRRPRGPRFPGFPFFGGAAAQPHNDIAPSGRPLTTSDMTQEQLRERRIRRIEAAKVARPLHEAVMLFALKIWLLVGPPAFVGLTVFEVSYIFQAFLPPGDSGDKIIFFGALFVDLAMMFTTFGVAIKRRDLAEKREVYGSVPKREEMEVLFGTFLWLIFAGINIVGQSAFLLHIVHSTFDLNHLTIIDLFIAARVVGFILGDACTAFFLAKVDSSPLKLIARAEREKGLIYADIADAEGKRQIAEAEAEARILLIQLDVEQKQRDAEFLAAIKAKAFAAALGDAPAPPAEPTRTRMYRGNT